MSGYQTKITALGALLLAASASYGESRATRLFAPCVSCHAPQAWGSADGNVPSLAGQQQWYLEKQLTAFGVDNPKGSPMQVDTQHAASGTAQSNVILARYLAALAVNPNPVKGTSRQLQLGQEKYTRICASCHAPDGGGNASTGVPRIAGQQYPYLRRQMERAALLHMDFAPTEMTGALRGMPDEDKNALADYISRLGSAQPSLAANGQ